MPTDKDYGYKKSQVIYAVQWTGNNQKEIKDFLEKYAGLSRHKTSFLKPPINNINYKKGIYLRHVFGNNSVIDTTTVNWFVPNNGFIVTEDGKEIKPYWWQHFHETFTK